MNHRTRPSVKSAISTELGVLSGVSREDLVARWQALYGASPPVRASQQLMFQAIAYRLQEQAVQPLKLATRRFLEQVVKGNSKKIIAHVLARPGTRLLRKWHGVTYEATVLDDGVLFQGQKYKSLSEVARTITGVRWSGPLFFGLKKKSEEKKGST